MSRRSVNYRRSCGSCSCCADDHRGPVEQESEWAAIGAAAQELGIGSSETLRKWVRQTEVDGEQRSGVTTAEAASLQGREGVAGTEPGGVGVRRHRQ